MATVNLPITAVDQDSAVLNVPIVIDYTITNPITRRETTPYTLAVKDGTIVTVTAPGVHQIITVVDSQHIPICYKFKEWTGSGSSPIFPKVRVVTVTGTVAIVLHMELQTVFPTVSPTRRISKFAAKTDEEVAAARTLALKPMMVEQAKVAYSSQVVMENKVGIYVYAQGFFGHQLHHYRNFAQAIWRLTRTYYGTTLQVETQNLADYWNQKGLVCEHLREIAKLFGITLNECPVPSPLLLLT